MFETFVELGALSGIIVRNEKKKHVAKRNSVGKLISNGRQMNGVSYFGPGDAII